jgi:cupin
VVEGGQCWLRFDDEPDPIQIGADDVIVIPRGSGYQLADDPRTPSIPLSDIVGGNHGGTHAVLRLGGGGAETRVICGAFEFLNDQAQSLLGVLPRFIQVGARTGRDEWLDATVTLLLPLGCYP